MRWWLAGDSSGHSSDASVRQPGPAQVSFSPANSVRPLELDLAAAASMHAGMDHPQGLTTPQLGQRQAQANEQHGFKQAAGKGGSFGISKLSLPQQQQPATAVGKRRLWGGGLGRRHAASTGNLPADLGQSQGDGGQALGTITVDLAAGGNSPAALGHDRHNDSTGGP